MADKEAVSSLVQQPAKPEKMLEGERQFEDCTPCRVLGASAFTGLGVFSYFSGHSQLKQHQAEILMSKSLLGMRSRRLGINALATAFVGLGLYRLVN